jgi:hypothetical protein
MGMVLNAVMYNRHSNSSITAFSLAEFVLHARFGAIGYAYGNLFAPSPLISAIWRKSSPQTT